MQKKSPITLKGLKNIERELQKLITEDREELKKKIQEARELGDLKENAEYHAAKEKQALVEGKISQFQHVIATSEIIDISKITNKTIVFGATVNLINTSTNKNSTYKIVGEFETDLSKGDISYKGPLGSALIGKEEGDTVVVKAPKGDIEYEIQSFMFIS